MLKLLHIYKYSNFEFEKRITNHRNMDSFRIIHLAITILVQYFLMRDLEKLTGSLRIALIYCIGALAGNMASAIFVPYRAEVLIHIKILLNF